MAQSPNDLRKALSNRVLIADGAMGTMLQAANPSLEDFQGHEGCNEVLNITRPDIVSEVHRAYLNVGVDLIETNTFGANWANLLEYGIPERIYEYNVAAAKIAREVADSFSTKSHPRFVIGSMGPGTKLPSLGHTTFSNLRDTFATQAEGLISGGADALLIETSQDLLQTKAAVIGALRAKNKLRIDVPVWAQVTVETTGTMLLGSEIGAALTALSPLGIEIIGLNCATGPIEMNEHLRYLSQNSPIAISAMPNAGLPILTSDGAYYPLSPAELADAHHQFVTSHGLSLIGGCCGTTPEHLEAVVERLHGHPIKSRVFQHEPSASSLYISVPFKQDNSYLAVGERTNATGSKAFRESLLKDDFEKCVDIAKEQIRDGAHILDLNIDYVGRDGASDMKILSALLATSSTLPIMLDSTEPEVLQAGLENLGGRAIVNSVNYEDGDGPTSRFQKTMKLVSEHGAAVVALTIDEIGMARTREHKVAVADRLINDLCSNWGLKVPDIMVDTLTFPIVTGQEETRRDGLETLLAIEEISSKYPGIQTILGLSNVSFGLNPAARQVLNSVFLSEAIKKGLTSAIVHPSKILPLSKIPVEQIDAALALIYDQRVFENENCVFDPLANFMELFENVDEQGNSKNRLQELLALPLFERLSQRIIDGEKEGLEADLSLALSEKSALAIVNEDLLSGMKVVGERFGAGTMQLPFVLQSAEVMKYAVSLLEPHMEKSTEAGKGTMVLATVKGDVHDIGKNLVDIILTNNGYNVINIGIKQPINTIIDSAIEHNADVIGMSGLLVKSTVIMKENLEEINSRGLAERFPIILGGAALTRTFVEDDLHDLYQGEVRYAKDAFEGLRLMDAIMGVKRGVEGATLPELKKRRIKSANQDAAEQIDTVRSEISKDNSIPAAPFFGSRVVKGFPLADFVSYLDERSLFLGQWGLKPSRSDDGASYSELVEQEGKPRLRYWLDRIASEQIMEPAVVYGYFPAYSDGNKIVVQNPNTHEEHVFSFPRQARDRRLCLADFVKPKGESDFVAFHVVTMGSKVSEVANQLFEKNDYRNYVELHGLSVALTEALAEYWHARVREELSISSNDSQSLEGILKQKYQGERFSFGYPACPELEHQLDLVKLLGADRIGVEVSEELQLHPEQSTSAIIFHHPEAAYFNAQ